MNKLHLAAITLVAVGSAGIGWIAKDLTSVAHISPAESILAAWQTQLDVLTDSNGKIREPDQSARIAKISFNALSVGLALHYDQLSVDQQASLVPFVERARVLEGSSEDVTLSVLGCLPTDKSAIDRACIQQAATNRFP